MVKKLGTLINRFISPYWPLLVLVIVLQIIATAMALYLPTLNARIIDEGVVKGDTDYIWSTGGFMLLMALVQALAQVAAVYCGARAAMAMGRDIRAAIFGRVLSFSTRELDLFGAPSLITRTTNDVQQVQMLVLMTCIMLVGAPITMIGGVSFALREDAGLSWLIAVLVGALAVSLLILASVATPLFEKMQIRIDQLNRVLREQITGIRVVRAFVREDYEAKRFDQANLELVDTTTKVGRIMVALFPLVMLAMNLGMVGVMWFGGQRLDSGELNIGQLTAFISYLIQILISVMMTTMLLVMAPRAAVCAQRIMAVLDVESSVVAPTRPAEAPTERGHVEFQQVSFSYPGAEEPVLKDLSFEILPGQTTAVIGSTGAGKSTLVNLVPRLFDATSGHVVVDGVNVKDLDPQQLWSRIALVPQRPYLFSGTVASNLKYGKPEATESQLWEALRIAQAEEFVKEREGGLDSEIAQGGTNVSGGQRQRLAIARALVTDAEVYVFDDSFSALDVATDARLRAALEPTLAEKAVLVVAQRVSTIRHADQILVLDNGVIVGRGTHDELLETCETYQEIVSSQLSAQEALA